jgi:hypothetical protein
LYHAERERELSKDATQQKHRNVKREGDPENT